jgi:hypothetical protein
MPSKSAMRPTDLGSTLSLPAAITQSASDVASLDCSAMKAGWEVSGPSIEEEMCSGVFSPRHWLEVLRAIISRVTIFMVGFQPFRGLGDKPVFVFPTLGGLHLDVPVVTDITRAKWFGLRVSVTRQTFRQAAAPILAAVAGNKLGIVSHSAGLFVDVGSDLLPAATRAQPLYGSRPFFHTPTPLTNGV